jgi:hypothetical protein
MPGILSSPDNGLSENVAKYISDVSFFDGLIHSREMKVNALTPVGYVYAARNSILPNVIKIGVCWDLNLHSCRLNDESQHPKIKKYGEKMVKERLQWLASNANLPAAGQFEIISYFATKHPYKAKWKMHEHFYNFKVANNKWAEFFVVDCKAVCDHFDFFTSFHNLPSFTLDLKGGGGALDLKGPSSTTRTNMSIISTQQLTSRGSWDTPIIPKLISQLSSFSNSTSQKDNSSTSLTSQQQQDNASTFGTSQQQQNNSITSLTSQLQQDNSITSLTSQQQQDNSSTSLTSQEDQEKSSPPPQCKPSRRDRRAKIARKSKTNEEAHPGLFIAEMTSGLHISLGPCWATKHYDSQDQDAHPLIVVHMVIPSRGKPF